MSLMVAPKADVKGVGAWKVGLVSDGVGTVAVIDHVGLELLVWAIEGDLEVLASGVAGDAIAVNSMDREMLHVVRVGGHKTGTLGVRVAGVREGFHALLRMGRRRAPHQNRHDCQ